VIKDEIRVGDDNRGAILRPHKGFRIKFDISFKDPAISSQHAKYEFKNGVFRHDIATARTFGFKEEVDAMNKAGLARGGSLENAIVVDNGKILNEGGLRFDDEFVRHKILDACGDLFTSGTRIQGEFVGKKSGHQTNNEILRTLFDNPTAWEYSE
jgi:UDP-3-O-[3-hydroxymyristoyl] N-acetylglucosamine deacetylase